MTEEEHAEAKAIFGVVCILTGIVVFVLGCIFA